MTVRDFDLNPPLFCHFRFKGKNFAIVNPSEIQRYHLDFCTQAKYLVLFVCVLHARATNPAVTYITRVIGLGGLGVCFSQVFSCY